MLETKPRRWGMRLVCLAAMVGPGQELAAQTIVRGRVFDTASDELVPNTLLRLVDESGEVRAALAADASGRYEVAAPTTGVYRLRASQVGYQPFESEPFEVQDTTRAITIDVGLRASPIPIRGVEVSTDRANRRIRDFLGMSPAQLRIRPIRSDMIQDYAMRGSSLSEMIRSRGIPNLQVLPSREGACYQFRGRGCMPVYLDGARLNRAPNSMLPLDMLSTVVIVLPNEVIAYPAGAVHLFTVGFMR